MKPSSSARVWVFRILLVLFVAGLLSRAWQARNLPFEQVSWAFESADAVLVWLLGLVRRELVGFGLAFLLGLLTPLASEPPADMGKRSLRWLGWWIFGVVVIALRFCITWSQLPPPGALLLPFASYLLGVWLSSSAQRGPRRFAWAVGQVSALGILLLALAAFGVRASVSAAPLQLDSGNMTAAGKRQLAERIRGTRPAPGQPRELQLTDAEINALLNSALNRPRARLQARVDFEPSAFAAQTSLALPRSWGAERFLNVRASGRLAIADGQLNLGIHDLRVGRLAVPAPVLRLFSSALYALILDDPQIRRIVEAIDALDLQPGAIRFVFQPGAVSRQVVPSLTQLLWGQPDVALETVLQVRHLIALYDRLAPDSDRFGLLMQAAFALAAERSAGHDPRLENRAALFALAILLGHPDLEPFVGEVLDPDLHSKARRMLDTVAVRGRVDWVRHFLVSAALVLVSNEATSDRIGLLKEQLDSDGGSGFSFGDMLANAAGTRFALAAIHDDPTARAVQARLTRGFEVDAIFPPAADLPEGIPADEFQARFGGIGGPGYRAIMEEINRRVAALPAF